MRQKIKMKVKIEPEQPMLSFNRICFGMMNNDWLLVTSASLKLLASVVIFMQFYNK